MESKIFNSELKVLNILWKNGDVPAKQIVKALKEEIDWSRSTTYTMIKRCIEKGLIENKGGDFICSALISKDEAQKFEIKALINNMCDGSSDNLIAAMVRNELVSKEELQNLKDMIISLA